MGADREGPQVAGGRDSHGMVVNGMVWSTRRESGEVLKGRPRRKSMSGGREAEHAQKFLFAASVFYCVSAGGFRCNMTRYIHLISLCGLHVNTLLRFHDGATEEDRVSSTCYQQLFLVAQSHHTYIIEIILA